MAPPKLNRLCSIEGCGKRHAANGYCATHRKRWKLYGDPLFVKQVQHHGLTLAERWNTYATDRGSGCWEWQGSRDSNGYGRLNVNGTPLLAHRISWELHFGAITSEDHVLHRCDNPPCVRPEHLFKGDQAANMADKMVKKRHRYGVRRGVSHDRVKLTEEQVRSIRASSEPPSALGQQFGISRRTVRDIQSRKTWKHLI